MTDRIADLEQSVEAQLADQRAISDAQTAVIEAQNAVLADQRRRIEALESAMNKILNALAKRRPPKPDPKVPERTRDDVRAIVLSEFAKRTTFIPGGGDIDDPTKAIQAWTTLAIVELGALTAPEAEVRARLGPLIQRDVDDHPSWPRVAQDAVVVRGTGELPS